MLVRLVIRLVALALVIGIIAETVSGIHVHGGFFSLLWIAVLFSVVNLIVGPLLRLLSAPLILLTLGLFLLVIDAALFGLTAALTSHLDVDHFWSALVAGALVALFGVLAEFVLPLRRRGSRSG